MTENEFFENVKYTYKLDYRVCRYKDPDIQKCLSEVLGMFHRITEQYIIVWDMMADEDEIKMATRTPENENVQLVVLNTLWGNLVLNKDEIKKSRATIMDKDDYPHVRASIKQ